MSKFEIICTVHGSDPPRDETEFVEFSDNESYSAVQQAENYAYALADKGPFEIVPIAKQQSRYRLKGEMW